MTTEDLQGQVARSAAVERELREKIAQLQHQVEEAKSAAARICYQGGTAAGEVLAKMQAETTRLREELAEARRSDAMGVQAIQRLKADLAEARGALREVRKWLQRAVEEQHHELDEDEEHEIPAQTRCGACGEESSPCTDLRCWVPHARAALARAGEQETPAAGEPASSGQEVVNVAEKSGGTDRASVLAGQGEPSTGSGARAGTNRPVDVAPDQAPDRMRRRDVPREAESRAVAGQGGKVHRCMRCGGEFACRTAGCEAKYDVLPRIVQRAQDGSVEVVEHECSKPTPPPGEQGKGGGEKCMRCGGAFSNCIHPPLAPAQPAEHPAKEK